MKWEGSNSLWKYVCVQINCDVLYLLCIHCTITNLFFEMCSIINIYIYKYTKTKQNKNTQTYILFYKYTCVCIDIIVLWSFLGLGSGAAIISTNISFNHKSTKILCIYYMRKKNLYNQIKLNISKYIQSQLCVCMCGCFWFFFRATLSLRMSESFSVNTL